MPVQILAVMAEDADFFEISLTVSNIEALWPSDHILSVKKKVDLFKNLPAVHEARSISRIDFALSKLSHFHGVHLIQAICEWTSSAVLWILSKTGFYVIPMTSCKQDTMWELTKYLC